ncbi:MAG TPA: hypothetical protein VD997_04050 [Phycisphaerales bacterium]|nr:hypothetical protein [Phycisphaerales bacterium]
MNALPGSRVYARTLVTNLDSGPVPVIGLASMMYQPTISHWTAGDTLLPFVNGGRGWNNSTPSGAISGTQVSDTTSFGRISPFAATNLTATTAIRGHYHANPTGTGVGYMRIALSNATAWFGGTGNSNGNFGVPIRQLNDIGRVATDPPFNPALENIAVFKFGWTIAPDSVKRAMEVSTPAEWMGNRNSLTGAREVYWFTSMTEASGADRGTALVIPATVRIIPAPGVFAMLVPSLGLALRRRRS